MQTVLVTGADRGLGYALTEEFLNKGFCVYAGQFMPEWTQLGQLKQIWKDRLELLPLDVSDGNSIRNMAGLLASKTEGLDFLVNNAGIVRNEEDVAEKVKEEDIVLQYRVNALGALQVTESVLPLMKKGKKRLCFVSSEAGSVGNAHRTEMFGYCMSKTALNMAVRLLHNDLYPQGFTFRVYHPGWVRSYIVGEDRSQGILEPETSAEAAVRQFLEDRTCENVLKMKDVDSYIWSF